ncbi:MAG: 2'-5' RNA ligase family protein [Acidimicrobiales bacterium]
MASNPNRLRLGVALLLDPPVGQQVDGLRRAVGDPSLGRVAPHVTLVPPVNVRADHLPAALARLRAAAASQSGPLRLTLGPPASFLPANPVLYMEVGGDLERLRILRDAVFAPPLARRLTWPWVPHVTLADGAEETRIAAAVAALDQYAVLATFDRVVMLQEQRGRAWTALADACLGRPAVVGTGGLSMELVRGRVLDPEALPIVEDACRETESGREIRPPGRRCFPVVITARREGEVVGTVAAWKADDGCHVAVVVARRARRQGVGGHLLAGVEAAVLGAGWQTTVLHAEGPPAFFRERSGWAFAGAGPYPAGAGAPSGYSNSTDE